MVTSARPQPTSETCHSPAPSEPTRQSRQSQPGRDRQLGRQGEPGRSVIDRQLGRQGEPDRSVIDRQLGRQGEPGSFCQRQKPAAREQGSSIINRVRQSENLTALSGTETGSRGIRQFCQRQAAGQLWNRTRQLCQIPTVKRSQNISQFYYRPAVRGSPENR